MPQPTLSDVHVNVPLTNISVAYIQSEGNFIADRVFANVPVQKRSDIFYRYPKDWWFRSEAQKRAPSTESAGGGFEVIADKSYTCDVYAVHKDIDDQIRANTDSVIRLDADTTRWVTHQLLLKRDKIWVSKFFKTGVWATDWTGSTGTDYSAKQFKKWSASGSDPISDIANAQLAIEQETAVRANTLVVDPGTDVVLKNHASIINRIVYTQPGFVTDDLLARAFGVDNYMVARAIENTAVEGETKSMSFMMPEGALLAYTPSNPGLMEPACGYTFSWTGYQNAGNMGNRISRMRKDEIHSDRIEGEMAFDMQVVASDTAIFISDPR